MTIEHIVNRLVKVLEDMNKLDRLTYNDYYFTQARVRKWIKWIEKEAGLEERELPKVNSSWKYIKYGD